MTKVWLVRHGATEMNECEANSVDKIRGWSDVSLNEEGREHANKTGKQLKSKKIHVLYTSDLKRAEETAHIISKYIKIKPKTDRDLRPWDLGTFTGKTTKESMPKIMKYIDDKPDEPVPDGESFNSFKDRAFGGLKKILRDHPDQVVALVTHHRFERLIKAWMAAGMPESLDMKDEVFKEKGEPPGSAELIELKSPKGGSLRNTIKDSIDNGKKSSKQVSAQTR